MGHSLSKGQQFHSVDCWSTCCETFPNFINLYLFHLNESNERQTGLLQFVQFNWEQILIFLNHENTRLFSLFRDYAVCVRIQNTECDDRCLFHPPSSTNDKRLLDIRDIKGLENGNRLSMEMGDRYSS